MLLFREMTPGMVSVFSTLLGSTADTCSASVYEAFWKNFTRFLLDMTAENCGVSAVAVHPGRRQSLSRCRGSLSWSRQFVRPWIFSSCCTRWSTFLFPGRAGSLPRRGAEAVSCGPDRSSDHREFAVAVRVGWLMSLFCGPTVLECSLRGDSWDPTVALVFLRGHCRAHSRRCATTDAGWFRRHSCCDVHRGTASIIRCISCVVMDKYASLHTGPHHQLLSPPLVPSHTHHRTPPHRTPPVRHTHT